jgi:Ca2+-transporting ATPase
VWLNGDPSEPITAVGPGIGLGLWLLVLALPGLQQLLNLAPLLPAQILILLAITALALLLAWQLAPHPLAERSP